MIHWVPRPITAGAGLQLPVHILHRQNLELKVSWSQRNLQRESTGEFTAGGWTRLSKSSQATGQIIILMHQVQTWSCHGSAAGLKPAYARLLPDVMHKRQVQRFLLQKCSTLWYIFTFKHQKNHDFPQINLKNEKRVRRWKAPLSFELWFFWWRRSNRRICLYAAFMWCQNNRNNKFPTGKIHMNVLSCWKKNSELILLHELTALRCKCINMASECQCLFNGKKLFLLISADPLRILL